MKFTFTLFIREALLNAEFWTFEKHLFSAEIHHVFHLLIIYLLLLLSFIISSSNRSRIGIHELFMDFHEQFVKIQKNKNN